MKSILKSNTAFIVYGIIFLGLIFISAKPNSENQGTKVINTTAKHTEQEVKELQKSQDTLVNAYYEDLILLYQSATPNKESLVRTYSLASKVHMAHMNKSEEVYESQMKHNVKEVFEKYGKLLDYKIYKSDTDEYGFVTISITEQFETRDNNVVLGLMSADNLWYIK